MVKIKICGLTNLDDALNAANAGADYLGFIFAESKRRISESECLNILKSLRPRNFNKDIEIVGVFMDQSVDYIKSIDDKCDFDLIQLHGRENTRDYRRLLNKPIIRRVVDFCAIEEYSLAEFLLFDKSVDCGAIIEIERLRELNINRPYFIAGSLDCDNIAGKLSVNPTVFGVDVASGIESYPGKKDEFKMRKFIEIVRSCQ